MNDKLLQVKEMIFNLYRKEPFLNHFIEDIVGFEVHLYGEDLFRDAYISRIEVDLQTKEHGTFQIYDLDGVEQLLWDLWYDRKIPKTEDEMEAIIYPVRRYVIGINEKVEPEIIDFYIDHLHDYVTGEINNIVYKT